MECNGPRAMFRYKQSINVCNACYALPKYTLITKTKTKQIYKLTDDELFGLTEYYGPGAYGMGEATYYTKEQVIACACIKHATTPDELDTVLHNIQVQKELVKQEKQQQRNQRELLRREKRRIKLMSRLNQSGLELRNDSALCQQYIDGVCKYDIDAVVKRMKQMKFLFEYCHMEECKDTAYEEYVDELDSGYYPDCSVFDRAEDIALSKYSGGKYPNKFPWENGMTENGMTENGI